jgi:muramidase (phage lysozyme)
VQYLALGEKEVVMKTLIHIIILSLIISTNLQAKIGKDDSGQLVDVINEFNTTFNGSTTMGAEDCDTTIAMATPQIASATAAGGLSKKAKAMLDMIAYAEGTTKSGKGYNVLFGGSTFSGNQHPRRIISKWGRSSDAAGRYQMLSTSWDEPRRALGLSDFSPANQDKAAMWLIKDKRKVNVESINTKADFDRAMRKLSYEWASLPGSPYGQPTHPSSEMWAMFKQKAGL